MSAETSTSVRWTDADKQEFFAHAISLKRTDPKSPAKQVARLAMMMMPDDKRRSINNPQLVTEMNKHVKKQMSTRPKLRVVRRAYKRRASAPAATPPAPTEGIIRNSVNLPSGQTVRLALKVGESLTFTIGDAQFEVRAEER